MNTKRALLTIVITAIFFVGSAAVHAAGPWNGTSLNGTTLNASGWNGTTLNASGWNGTTLNAPGWNGTTLNAPGRNGTTLNAPGRNGTTLNKGGWNGTTLNASGIQGRSFNGLGEAKKSRTAPNAESMKADSAQRQMIKNFRSNGLRLNAIILPEEQCKDMLPVGIAITR